MVTLNSCPSASQVWDCERERHARLWYLGLAAVRVLCVDSFSTDISPCDGVIKSCLLAKPDCVLRGHPRENAQSLQLELFKNTKEKTMWGVLQTDTDCLQRFPGLGQSWKGQL